VAVPAYKTAGNAPEVTTLHGFACCTQCGPLPATFGAGQFGHSAKNPTPTRNNEAVQRWDADIVLSAISVIIEKSTVVKKAIRKRNRTSHHP